MTFIKFPSIDSIKYLVALFHTNSDKDNEEIKKLIFNYLINKGSKKFVELYNQTIFNNDVSILLEKLQK